MRASRLRAIADGQKACRLCGVVKPLDDYPTVTRHNEDRTRSWTYPRTECKTCMNALHVATYNERKEAWLPAKRRRYAKEPRRHSYRGAIRRAKEYGLTEFLSLAEWQALYLFKTCHWCDMELHPGFRNFDHIVPLSEGGSHLASNLVAACANCNQRRTWERRTKFKEGR